MRVLLIYSLSGIMIGVLFISLVMLRFKIRHSRRNKYADEIAYNLRNGGVDKHYEGLSTDELLLAYEELNNEDNTVDYKKEMYRSVEIGCRAKLIEDVLNSRGVTIPEWK